jgi:ankyrin repeat protein
MSIFDEIWACSTNANRTVQEQIADGDAVISEYLRRGGDINARDTRDSRGYSVLFTATSQGHAGGVKKLIAAGTDVDAQTDDGETALCRAIGNGYLQIAKLLIEAGADANLCRTAGKTPLILATDCGWDEVASLLRERAKSPPSPRALTQQDKPGVHPQKKWWEFWK